MLYVIWILLMIYWGLRIIFSTGKFIIGLFIDKSSENNSYHSMNSVTLPPPIDTRTEDEIDKDWTALLDLSKLVNNIYAKILDKYSIDCCSSCGHNTYILNDVDTSKVTLECISCSEEVEKNKDRYTRVYDVVICGDGNWDCVNDLWRQLMA